MISLVFILLCLFQGFDFSPEKKINYASEVVPLYFGSSSNYFISKGVATAEKAKEICHNVSRTLGRNFYLGSIKDDADYKRILERLKSSDVNVNGVWITTIPNHAPKPRGGVATAKIPLSNDRDSIVLSTTNNKISFKFSKRVARQIFYPCEMENCTGESEVELESSPSSYDCDLNAAPICEPPKCAVTLGACHTVTPSCNVTNLPDCTTFRPECHVSREACNITTPPCTVILEPCTTTEPNCTTHRPPCKVVTHQCNTTRKECTTYQPPCKMGKPLPCTTTHRPCTTTYKPCRTTHPPCFTSKGPCVEKKASCYVRKHGGGELVCPPPTKTCGELTTNCPPPVTVCDPVIDCKQPPILCQSPAMICPQPITNCPPPETVCPPPDVICKDAETICGPPELNCPTPKVICPPAIVTCPPPEVSCPAAVTSCPSPETICPPPLVNCPLPVVNCKPGHCRPPPPCPPPPTPPTPPPPPPQTKQTYSNAVANSNTVSNTNVNVAESNISSRRKRCLSLKKELDFKWSMEDCRTEFNFLCSS